ncbi:MAG TPA: protealysin inhibitor emfourin [Candidatus Angelobacter sp.]|jgi:hypothetical protein
MEVQFERSGGFAGIVQRYSASLESLPEEEQRKLQELITNAHFFDQPSVMQAPSSADHLQYKIFISSGQQSHEVRVDQGAVPAELQPLIAWLQAAARKH